MDWMLRTTLLAYGFFTILVLEELHSALVHLNNDHIYFLYHLEAALYYVRDGQNCCVKKYQKDQKGWYDELLRQSPMVVQRS